MRADNAAFAQYNTAASKRPRVVVRVSFDTANTDFLYFTSHPDCDLPDGAISSGLAIENCVRSISGQSQQINPDQANSTIGGFSYSIVDTGESSTVYLRDKLVAGFGLRHKQVVAYVGYQGMLWADYKQVLTYIIDNDVSYINGEYKFKCSDIQRAVRQQIFDADVTYLTKTVGATDTHIPCLATDLTKFKAVAHDASYTDHPSATVSYIRIEDEIICHSGLFVHGTDGTSFQVVQRGALNSKAAEHVMDSGASSERKLKITEHIFIEGPAPKVIYALLTGELYGQSAQLPTKWHLGINTAYVAIADFLALGPDYWDTTTNTGRHVRFEGEKKTDGKKFIETELLLWLGAYMPVYSNGQLGLRRLAPVLSNSGYVVKLDRSNIVGYSELVHDYTAVINQIDIQWNHIFLKDDFTKTTYLIDADSYAIHGSAPVKTLKFKGIKTGSHADTDLASYFDTLRDRYAGPPLRLNLTVKPSLNWLEVGDTVRVDLDEIRDFTNAGGTKLDRVFEIQQVSHDWFTGDVKLDLFGSSMKAGTLVKTALSSVLDDAFYNSAGTDLSTVLTITAGVVTGTGNIPGGTTMAAGIYYYLGDLTIDATALLTFNQNTQLRVRGFLTINGGLDGKGRGHVGGTGGTALVTTPDPRPAYADAIDDNSTDGIAGFLGTTIRPGATRFLNGASNSGNNYFAYQHVLRDTLTTFRQITPVVGAVQAVPYFGVRNVSTNVQGLPTDLRGSSGGGACVAYSNTDATQSGPPVLDFAGGNGGNGGAGLMIISRGLAFGAAGYIDTSGNDGAPGGHGIPTVNTHSDQRTFWNGYGAGGAPGGLAIFLDGNHTPPELATEHRALQGDSWMPDDANNGSGVTTHLFSLPTTIGSQAAVRNVPAQIPFRGFDMGDSAYTLQYIPEYKPIEEELPPPPPDVTGFAAVNDGLHARLTWNALDNNEVEKYRVKSGTVWSSGTFIADVTATELRVLMSVDTTYNFMIKAVHYLGRESAAVASVVLVGLPSISIADNLSAETLFYHFTGDSIAGMQSSNIVLNNNGYLYLNSASTSYLYKNIETYNSAVTWAKRWRMRVKFKVESGTGQYLYPSTTPQNGFVIGIGDSLAGSFFGLCCAWNGSSIIGYIRLARSPNAYNGSLTPSLGSWGTVDLTLDIIYVPNTHIKYALTDGYASWNGTLSYSNPILTPSFPAPGDALTKLLYIRNVPNAGVPLIRVYDVIVWSG